MKKKNQTQLKEMCNREERNPRGKIAAPTNDAWERLMKIREKLSKASTPSEKSDEPWENLMKTGEEIGKNWENEKSAVEILSEMRR